MLHIADGHTAQTYTVEVRQFWSRGRELNPRPPDYEALVRHFAMFFSVGDLRENAAVDPEPGLVGAYLLVHPHPMFWRERQRIAQLASETGPPAIYESAD